MSERKAVLLNKSQADLKTIVSTDGNRPAMTNINVTSQYAEAVNGHILLRVPHDTIDSAEFPTIDGQWQGLNGENVLLDPKVLEKAFKNTGGRNIPILDYVHLALTEKEEPLVSATDLDTQVTFKQRKVEDTFPNTEQVWPSKVEWQFTLAAAELKRIVGWALKHGSNGKDTNPSIRFSVDPTAVGSSAVQVEIPRSGEKAATGLIMPYAGDYEHCLIKAKAREAQRQAKEAQAQEPQAEAA